MGRGIEYAQRALAPLVTIVHSELHWLHVPQRIQFKLGVTVHRCRRGNAPQYLVDCCKSTTDAVSRQRLRSAIVGWLMAVAQSTKFGTHIL